MHLSVCTYIYTTLLFLFFVFVVAHNAFIGCMSTMVDQAVISWRALVSFAPSFSSIVCSFRHVITHNLTNFLVQMHSSLSSSTVLQLQHLCCFRISASIIVLFFTQFSQQNISRRRMFHHTYGTREPTSLYWKSNLSDSDRTLSESETTKINSFEILVCHFYWELWNAFFSRLGQNSESYFFVIISKLIKKIIKAKQNFVNSVY